MNLVRTQLYFHHNAIPIFTLPYIISLFQVCIKKKIELRPYVIVLIAHIPIPIPAVSITRSNQYTIEEKGGGKFYMNIDRYAYIIRIYVLIKCS